MIADEDMSYFKADFEKLVIEIQIKRLELITFLIDVNLNVRKLELQISDTNIYKTRFM